MALLLELLDLLIFLSKGNNWLHFLVIKQLKEFMKGRDLTLYHVTYSNVILQIDPAPNMNDLGHYMKSYKKYVLSKFTIIVLLPEIFFDSD